MFRRILVVLVIASSLVFIGWGNNWDEIKTSAAAIKSIKSDFTQEKHMKILSRPLISKGRFYYSNPASLRWEYNSPIKSILLMKEGSIKRYIKGRKGYVRDSSANLQAMRIVLQEITLWLKGEFKGNPDFKTVLNKGLNTKIILTPKKKALSNIIKRIELRLSEKPGIIQSVTIYENRNSYTILKFKNVKLNKKIDDSIFSKI
ncbi:MAG: outer membrane lipoprotein carrier protein LolA [bacterium]|nr:outer membrane lipoprotein carrier protein LolA [bacterium]